MKGEKGDRCMAVRAREEGEQVSGILRRRVGIKRRHSWGGWVVRGQGRGREVLGGRRGREP